MQTNLWNLVNSKERFGIRQRTYAQKRHLLCLLHTKTKLDNHTKQWKIRSLNSAVTRRLKQDISKNNKQLMDRLTKTQNSKPSTIKGSTKKFNQYGENLRIRTNINRYKKLKTIQLENDKIFDRLINTSSTLSRQSWMKNQQLLQKYKFNRTLTKYSNPDYSKEVSKINKNKKISFKHLKLSKCSQAQASISSSQFHCLRS